MAMSKPVSIIVVGAVAGALVGGGAAFAYMRVRKPGSAALVSGERRAFRRISTDPTNYAKILVELMVLFRLVKDLFDASS
jgi:hypothetical protein